MYRGLSFYIQSQLELTVLLKEYWLMWKSTYQHRLKQNLKKILRLTLIVFIAWYAFALPKHLFNTTYSHVVLDKNDSLLGAHIAKDE